MGRGGVYASIWDLKRRTVDDFFFGLYNDVSHRINYGLRNIDAALRADLLAKLEPLAEIIEAESQRRRDEIYEEEATARGYRPGRHDWRTRPKVKRTEAEKLLLSQWEDAFIEEQGHIEAMYEQQFADIGLDSASLDALEAAAAAVEANEEMKEKASMNASATATSATAAQDEEMEEEAKEQHQPQQQPEEQKQQLDDVVLVPPSPQSVAASPIAFAINPATPVIAAAPLVAAPPVHHDVIDLTDSPPIRSEADRARRELAELRVARKQQ